MWSVYRELKAAVADLFRTRRDRTIVAGLILFGAIVSAAELLIAHLFSTIILPKAGEVRPMDQTILLALVFLIVFGGLRVVNYAQSVYRVSIFEKAFKHTEMNGTNESWRWATAMELTSLLSLAARIAVISIGLFLLSPLFASVNLLVGFGVVLIFGRSLQAQLVTQRTFREQKNSEAPPTSATKVRARIKAGELGALVASIGVMFEMALLILLAVINQMPPSIALVVFLAIRMIGQMYSGMSTGLMRFARARVNSA